MSVTYVGSGPYCYANSLAMILGEDAPSPAVIEVLTGSPYGLLMRDEAENRFFIVKVM